MTEQPPPEHIDLDTALGLVANQYRRRVLLALGEENPQQADDPQIPANEPIADEEWEHLQIQLQHTHLPKLEDASVIEWDRNTNHISKGPQFDALQPLLRLIDDYSSNHSQ